MNDRTEPRPPAEVTKPGCQTQLSDTEGAEIRARIQTWAGGPENAARWYRSQPIAAFGDRTPESLVGSGQARILRHYLDSIALGGFA